LKDYRNAMFTGAMIGAAATLIFRNVNFRKVLRAASNVYFNYEDETGEAVRQVEAKSKKAMNFVTNVGQEVSDIIGK